MLCSKMFRFLMPFKVFFVVIQVVIHAVMRTIFFTVKYQMDDFIENIDLFKYKFGRV